MNKRLLPAYFLTFVNVLGFSILMPVLPFIVEDYGGEKWMYGLLLTFYSAFQFIGSPFLGAMSDWRGRKPILILSQAGTLLSWFVFLFALSLPEIPIWGIVLPLWIIGASRMLDGITGGNTSVANAYVADITTREEKSYIFGYLGGIAGLGMILGPGIGGLSSSTSLGYSGTILAAIVISILTLIALFAWLKESLPPEKRTERKRQSFIKSIIIPLRVAEVDPGPIIKLLFTMKLCFSIMMAFYIATIALFMIDLFSFNAKELGIFMFVVGIFLAFNQAFLAKRFVKKFGEFNTLLIGLGLCVLGLGTITLTNNLYLYIGFYYVLNLGLSLTFPTFNALIAIHSDPKKKGEIMGISESIGSFATAAFPILGAAMYGWIGFELYYLIAALPLLALVIALSKFRKMHLEQLNEV